MIRQQRNLLNSKAEYLKAKNLYFLSIKRAKRDHWNQFLEKTDPQSIYKAMAYTRPRLVERIPPIKAQPSTRQETRQNASNEEITRFDAYSRDLSHDSVPTLSIIIIIPFNVLCKSKTIVARVGPKGLPGSNLI